MTQKQKLIIIVGVNKEEHHSSHRLAHVETVNSISTCLLLVWEACARREV